MRAWLAPPAGYRAFGWVIGAERAHATLAREYLRPRPGARLLDIGCGPGDLVRYLNDVEYLGVDPSADYVRAAKARYPHARFVCSEIADHPLAPGTFDLAVAAGVLHHLDDTEALRLFTSARQALCPGGRLVTLDGCYLARQRPLARKLLELDRGRHVRTPAGYVALAGEVFGRVGATLRADLLRVPYDHVLLECGRE